MRRLTTLSSAVAIVLGSLAVHGTARCEGTIGVYFDTAGTVTLASPPLLTTDNEFYVVVNGVPEGELKGFEFDLLIDPNILVFGVPRIVVGPPLPVFSGPYEFIVGLQRCSPAAGPTVLVEFTYGIFSTESISDLELCLFEASPSSFSPPVPGYLTCDGALEPFFTVPSACPGLAESCAVVYPTCAVATSSDSWGSVKGRF